jgi:hypothetical protein
LKLNLLQLSLFLFGVGVLFEIGFAGVAGIPGIAGVGVVDSSSNIIF